MISATAGYDVANKNDLREKWDVTEFLKKREAKEFEQGKTTTGKFEFNGAIVQGKKPDLSKMGNGKKGKK